MPRESEDAALLYAATGGIAEYLDFVDTSASAEENLIRLFFEPNGRLVEEPDNLLKQELREPKRYSTILAAITSGASKNNQIATKTGISSGALTNYLEALIDLGIVSRESPWVAPGGRGAMGAGVRFHEVPVQVADAADETRFTEFKMAVSGSGTASCGRTSPLLRCMPDVPPSRQQWPRN